MKNKKTLALLAILLLSALLLPASAVFAATETEVGSDGLSQTELPKEPESEATPPPSAVREGTYRLRNSATGLYLCTLTYYAKNKTTWRVAAAPLDAKDNGQCFVLKTDAADRWTLTAKNNSGLYSVACESGTGSGAQVTQKKNAGEEALFDITPVGEFFTIAPSEGENLRAVLSVGSEAYKKDLFCEITDYVRGNEAQLWTLEPIAATGLTVAYDHTSVKLYSTGTFGAAMAPEGTAVTDAQWFCTDNSVLLLGNDGSYCALSPGTADVSVTKDGYTASFRVTVADSDCFAWFSQNSASNSDWDASLLTNQYWSSDGVKMRYIWDSETPGSYRNWMDSGCALCSLAMVLRNMGATASGFYDFRSARSEDLPADPYICSLANTGRRDIQSGTGTYYGDPIYVAWSRILEAYTVNGEKLALRRDYSANRQNILKLLASHPQGVIAMMTKGADTHYIVISDCINPTEKVASKLEFRVFDPAATKPQDGNHVKFTESTSYKYMYYRYSNISYLIVVDTEANLNR